MSDIERSSKRRKVRKGTQSCWECRRRKVRCIFSAATKNVCVNCTRRKTSCVSQELSENSSPQLLNGEDQLHMRLNRVEELLVRLSNPHRSDEFGINDPNPRSLDFDAEGSASAFSGEFTPESRPIQSYAPEHRNNSQRFADGFQDLNDQMTMAWPSQHELELIRALPVGLSSQLHCGFCRPVSSIVEKGKLRTAELLHLPPAKSHPVLFARKLLILGTFIQAALPSGIQALEDQGHFPRRIMHRVVDTATKLVTTRDELLNSVEAIECIVLEAMYHNYSGNLHRSWRAIRRAITTAEAMTLHRRITSPSVKFLEPNARKDFDIDDLTFRLAEMDAYLSIMLGLPLSSLDTRHITHEKALTACCAAERMRRIHYIVQQRIIARSTSIDFDLAEVHETDRVLQKAAAEMSPCWWLTPNFKPDDTDETKMMHDMIRLMGQLSHYHLLIRLHLPYVLSPDRRCDYSKVIAVNTSRELLTRFVSFRTSNPAHYYCRGSDCLAFIASTILCVVHIKSSEKTINKAPGEFSDSSGYGFLAHSRLTDRGLMEQALEIIEGMYEPGTDAISTRISQILRDLLFIESSASTGNIYSVSSSEATDEDLECEGRLLDGGKAMRIHIPNFGSIDLVRGTVSRTIPAHQESRMNVSSPLSTLGLIPHHSPNPTGSDATPDELSYAEESSQQVLYGTGDGTQNQSEIEFPWADGDDWDLQGVDFALFDTLFSGSLQVEDHTDTF